MRNIYKLFAATLSFIISTTLSAQTYSGYSDVSITLKSDTTTRSSLISNLIEDRAGDVSPIIGAAAWFDNNKNLQCRSLLSFNYGILPKLISPDQIVEARLILKPVEIITKETISGTHYPKIIVRRVLQPWEDSVTNWITQPTANLTDEAVKNIPEKKRNRPVSIDVTSIVKNMFLYGNNGFMIRYEDSLQGVGILNQWFASARFEDEELRPELMIRWSRPANYRPPTLNLADASLPSDVMRQYYNQAVNQPYVQPQPVNPPPTPVPEDPKPKGNNNGSGTKD